MRCTLIRMMETTSRGNLFPYQEDAVNRMHNGCILVGGVGSGKSRTALAYYIKDCGGSFDATTITKPHQLYIITTARKRDTMEWKEECTPFGITDAVVDSWNNVHKYVDVKSAFFIFDEQRVVGTGTWAKSFIKIAKRNHWILLSATPGDTWLDYMPVFIANGFYKGMTDFKSQHVVYSRFSKFPRVDKYVDIPKLVEHRDSIIVDMDYQHEVMKANINIPTLYDKPSYVYANRERWNSYEDKPMLNASELCYVLRRIVNSDPSRLNALTTLAIDHPKLIVFYNFDYELELLRNWAESMKVTYGEYNGHKHDPLPTHDRSSWVYLVQYTAGAEGWNCIETDTIVFFSLNYSYKIMTQAAGRIDRLTSPFKKLYYFRLVSSAPIDLAIKRALSNKRNFNESAFANISGYNKT